MGTATLHEASGQRGALPSAVKPVHPSFRLCGRALPVACGAADNLWLHRALYEADPGDVLVATTAGEYEAGYWGEIMSHAARARDLAGVVIDGCVRDGEELGEVGVPVFARGLCIRGTTKDEQGTGSIGRPVVVGDVEVNRDDVVVGDGDGVVVLTGDAVDEIVPAALTREEKERGIVDALARGERTLDIYGWSDQREPS